MNVKHFNRGRALKTVTFENVTTETEEDIRNEAYAFYGETRESTFGTNLVRFDSEPGVVRVEIWVD
jgi:hypothetical protein